MENIILSPITLPEFKAMIQEAISTELHNVTDNKPKTDEADELLTSTQTAKLLRVSKVTLHKWKLAGKIKYHRIGSRIRFKRVEVLAALKEIDNKH